MEDPNNEESPEKRATESAAISTVSCTIPLRNDSPAVPGTTKDDSSLGESSSTPKRVSSFLENGAKDIFAASECGFPLPKTGQTLREFLAAGDFSTLMTPLDKENAHFHIAEALIQAFESYNFFRDHERRKDATSESETERDTRPVFNRRTRRRFRERKLSTLVTSSFSPTTDYSLSPGSSGLEGTGGDADDSLSEEDSDHSQTLTAEGFALHLLKNFEDKPLLKASDLVWMVSEADTKQGMLPLPDFWSDSATKSQTIQTRGNDQWAPPRKQIIYNVIFREQSDISSALAKQNFRCAGCGTKVDRNSKLRMCHYLGKYFCQSCHQNAKCLIPARIALKWDFTLYPVSNFARDLLQTLERDPVIDLCDYSKGIYTRARQLQSVSNIRRALTLVSQYVLNCKNANVGRLLKIPEYLYLDRFKFSIEDFVKTRTGNLYRELLDCYERCVRHVQTCQHCTSQAFFCEKCRNDDLIFPFDIENILQCCVCRACFHKKCVKGAFICGRCQRREKRNRDTIQEAEEALEL